MSFRNGIKLLCTNFHLVWSVMLYTIMVCVPIVAILYGVWYPTFSHLAQEDFVVEFVTLFTNYFNGTNNVSLEILWKALTSTTKRVFKVLLGSSWQIVLSLIVILLVLRFFMGLKDLAIADCVNAKASANMKVSFFGAYFSNFLRSWKFVLCRTLFTLPFDCAIAGLTYFVYWLCKVCGITGFSPFLIILTLIALTAFKQFHFNLWPVLLVKDANKFFPSLRQSLSLAYHNSGRVYSNILVMRVIVYLLAPVITIFSFGVGLVFLIPVMFVFEHVLSLTVLNECMGSKYYISANEIYTPENHGKAN